MKILWFSEIKWNYLVTRKQHLLKRFDAECEIVFFQPFSLSGDNNWTVRYDKSIRYITIPTYRRGNRFFRFCLNLPFIRAMFYYFSSLYSAMVALFMFKGKPDVICISNVFYIPHLWLFDVPIVWDLNDHPEQFGKLPKWGYNLFRNFLANESNHIISSSNGLKEWVEKKYQRKVGLISNGVDLKHFTIKNKQNQVCDRSVLGYVGIVSSWFFDFELVEKLAHTFPNTDIHIYGPQSKKIQAKLTKLKKMRNVNIFDVVSYDELPEILQTFSVGIIPLKSIPEVWRLASSKLLQYLAVGLPVVSVWMSEYDRLKNVIMCKSHNDFISKVEKILTKKNKIANQSKELSNYDWTNLSISYQTKLKKLCEKNRHQKK